MSKSTLQCTLESLGYETMSYSGRDMYGKKCLAIDVDGDFKVGAFVRGIIREVAELVTEDTSFEHDVLADEVESLTTDSLGRGTVVYWPDVPFVGEEKSPNSDVPEVTEDDEMPVPSGG